MAARRALTVVAAILAIGTGVSGWSCASIRSTLDRVPNKEGAATTASSMIAVNGVHLTVPVGWESESFVNPSGMAVIRLGSFEFRHARDDDVGQTAQASMGASDVLINMIDVTATDPGVTNSYYTAVPSPLTVDGADALQQEGYKVPAAVIRGVRINAHNLYLSVAFGTAPPSRAQVASANAVLRTLVVP